MYIIYSYIVLRFPVFTYSSFLVQIFVIVAATPNEIWRSPDSVDTSNELNGFHVLSGHTFGFDDSMMHTHDPTNSHINVLKVFYKVFSTDIMFTCDITQLVSIKLGQIWFDSI